MDLNIDLGQDSSKDSGPEAAPSSETSKQHYPSFVYSGDAALDIPDEGEMTILYKKASESKTTTGNQNRHVCIIDVREIVSVESADEEAAEPADENEPTPPARNPTKESGSALDTLMEAHIKSKKKAGY